MRQVIFIDLIAIKDSTYCLNTYVTEDYRNDKCRQVKKRDCRGFNTEKSYKIISTHYKVESGGVWVNKNKKVNNILEYVKGTMAFEDMELPDDTLEIYEKYLKGKITESEVRELLIKKNLSEEV